MAKFTLAEVLTATGGSCGQAQDLQFLDVSTDTRTISDGCLFVALRGANFDGHDFLDKARELGALAAIVEVGHGSDALPCIEVENTLRAYQDLARFHRRRFSIPVIAITGSSGKTTTKDMVAAVLSTELNVLKTEKNFNNEIGLPKTLLQLTEEHEACVVEMGMRGLGQIEELALIAEPTLGIVTNVGTSHIELLGSRENIGKAKAELIECLPADSLAILNADDDLVAAMESVAKGQVMMYGIDHDASVQASHISYKKDGISFACQCLDKSFDVFLPMIGIHNVYDALAAIGAGAHVGISPDHMKEGLSVFTGTPMRQELVAFTDMVILNDAYNANPSSMAEAIKALGQLEGHRKVAMIGDMLELGDFTEEGHRQTGRLLVEEGYDLVYTFGEAAKFVADEVRQGGVEVHVCSSHLEMANAYWDARQAGDVVLVKGSRGLRMERVVEELKEREEN
ncbi:MAG: UDP-N-acetylmuramoyl-tripeptide--D-alanyl-D-alanine ligase [Veillonella sp.]|nr:UDP-N-acetylmuramoyl-tripeptide--D-alanyl-D-alanine ligase [Veillonella sp.]